MHANIHEIDADRFEEVVLKAKFAVVDFYSDECPPCEALAPKFEGLAELYGKDITFVKVFRQKNRPLAESLGVKGSPSVVFFAKGERIGPTLTGGIKKSALQVEGRTPAERAEEFARLNYLLEARVGSAVTAVPPPDDEEPEEVDLSVLELESLALELELELLDV